MKYIYSSLFLCLLFSCEKTTDENQANRGREAIQHKSSSTTHSEISPEEEKVLYPELRGSWVDQEYLMNLRKLHSINAAESKINFYTTLTYIGGERLYGNEPNFMEEMYLTIKSNKIVTGEKEKEELEIIEVKDSILVIQDLINNKQRIYKRALNAGQIETNGALYEYTSKGFKDNEFEWIGGQYTFISASDSTHGNLELSLDKNGKLVGHPDYDQYFLFSYNGFDIIGFTSKKESLKYSEYIFTYNNESGFDLKEIRPIDEVDAPVVEFKNNKYRLIKLK